MTKLNIHAQSIQNPFANISSRIYFSYWLLEKGKKGKKKTRGGSGRREEAEDDGWLLWGGPDVLSIHFKADMSKLH